MSIKKLQGYIVVLVFVIVVFFASGWLKMRLPAGYHFWNDDKYWHTAILGEENIVVPPTVVDHAVRGNYIIALRVNRDSHYSIEHCESCRTLSAPCAEYWVINWKSKERIGPMGKENFIAFLGKVDIKLPKLGYDMPKSASRACRSRQDSRVKILGSGL